MPFLVTDSDGVLRDRRQLEEGDRCVQLANQEALCTAWCGYVQNCFLYLCPCASARFKLASSALMYLCFNIIVAWVSPTAICIALCNISQLLIYGWSMAHGWSSQNVLSEAVATTKVVF